jgi:hypothetical protein
MLFMLPANSRVLATARRLLAAAMLLPLAASAEIVCALGTATSGYQPTADQRPSSDTMQVVRRVDEAYKSICLPKCPGAALLRNSTAPNLMLYVNADGGKMVYSPAFFSGVYGKYGETGIIALIAHVYGHAIDETTQSSWLPANWDPELRADAWAGCVLAKTSLPSSGVTSALGALATYPPLGQTGWSRRVPAVRLGYTHCGGEVAKFDSASSGLKSK